MQGPGLFGLLAWHDEGHDGGPWRALPGATVPVAGTLTRFEYRLLHRAGFVTLLLEETPFEHRRSFTPAMVVGQSAPALRLERSGREALRLSRRRSTYAMQLPENSGCG